MLVKREDPEFSDDEADGGGGGLLLQIRQLQPPALAADPLGGNRVLGRRALARRAAEQKDTVPPKGLPPSRARELAARKAARLAGGLGSDPRNNKFQRKPKEFRIQNSEFKSTITHAVAQKRGGG